MSEQLGPDPRWQADVERRLRTIEASPRVGLHRLRWVYATASVDPVTFDAWESGATGCTWADDQGGSGSGYASVTATTGRRALLFFGCRVINLASDAGVTYKSSLGLVGVGQDGVDPDGTSAPTLQRQVQNPLTGPIHQNVAYIALRRNLTPGEHTFVAKAKWTLAFGGASTTPRMTDTFIGVLPID